LNKKILIGSVIGVSVLAVASITYFILKKYNKKDLTKGSFLFLGDSTTANSNGYVEKFQKSFPDAKIKKIAESGQKTDWMLTQFKNEIAKGNKYDVVVSLGGSNDIFSSLRIDKAEANLDEIYSLAKKMGAKIIAITPPNKSFFPNTTDKHRQLISDFGKWIKSNKKVDIFIDLDKLSNDKNLFASDYQHINDKGHEILKNEFVKKLA
jgi:lysophospholipase L1-like esterase